MKTLCFLLLVSIMITGCLAGGTTTLDTVNRKIANAVCIKDTRTQTMTLDLHIAFNGNQVDRVMALDSDTFVRTSTGTNEVSCTKSDITGGEVTLQSRVSLSGTADDNRCGARRLANTNNFKWTIEVRAAYSSNAYVDIDRRYQITCTYDTATSNFATAQIIVIGKDLTGTSERLRPVNTMSVLGKQTNNVFTATDRVQLDQYVKLQITSEVTATPTTRDIYGLHAFSCDFGPLNKNARTIFIGTNGCPISPNIFLLTNGFKFSVLENIPGTSAMQMFKTQTDMFVMANSTSLPTNNFYYLSCYVNYCFGVPGSDAKCTDFCDVSRTGRKKRQDEDDLNIADLDSITLVVQIGEGEETTTTTEEPDTDKSRMAIIVASTAASVVFLIILFIVVFLLCWNRGACCGNHDDQLWEESSASTESTKRHGNFVYPHPPSLVQPKA